MPFVGYPVDCPPNDSAPCAEQVYRLVSGNQPTVTDFQSYLDRYGVRAKDDPCLARGLSVCLDFDAAVRLRKRLKAFRTHKIAVAQLDTTAGLIKQTTDNVDHHTWWLNDGFDPLTVFALDPQETV